MTIDVTVTDPSVTVTVSDDAVTVAVVDQPVTVTVAEAAPGRAAEVSYTPADGADWPNPDPTNVADALDALAAGGVGGGSGTITSVNGDVGPTVVLDYSDVGAQPVDSDLTAIAALSTTTYGRSLLTLADAAAGRTSLGLGTAATSATSAFDAAGSAAAAQAASQPLDSDLTAIAALTTTSYGRSFLALADAAAGRTALGLGTAALSASGDFQPVDSDLTAIAALTTTTFGRSLLTAADAAAARTLLGAGDALTTSSLAQFAATTSAELRTLISDETGTGSAVFATSPTLVTPNLGTPSALTLTNATGLPAAGVTGTALVTSAIGTTVQAYNTGLSTLATAFSSVNIARRSLDRFRGGAPCPDSYLVSGAVIGSSTTTTMTVKNRNLTRPGIKEVLRINDEQMLVVAGQGTTSLTVVRGVNGTTASASHAADDKILRSKIRNVCIVGDSTAQGTSPGTGLSGEPFDAWSDRLRKMFGERFGGSLGYGFTGIWRNSSLANSAVEWSETGTALSAVGDTVAYDMSPFAARFGTSSAHTLKWTRPPGVQVQQFDFYWIDFCTATGVAGNQWSYRIDGGSWTDPTHKGSFPSATTTYADTNGLACSTWAGATAMAITSTTSWPTSGEFTVVASGGTAHFEYVGMSGNSPQNVNLIQGDPAWTIASSAVANIKPQLKKTAIECSNPTTIEFRCANAAGTSSTSIFVGADIWSTRPVFGVTSGLKFHNVAQDGKFLAELVRGRAVDDLTTTSGSTTIGSANSAAFATADINKTISGTAIPSPTTITARASATSATVKSSTNITTESTGGYAYIQGTVGDWGRLFDGSPASLIPDLTLVMFTNDISAEGLKMSSRGTVAASFTGSITSNVLTLTAGAISTNDTGKVISGTGVTAGTTITYLTSTTAAVTHANLTSRDFVLCAKESTLNAAIKDSLNVLHERLSPYSDILYIIPFEQGGVRLDGSQSTAAKQATWRAAFHTKIEEGRTVQATISSGTSFAVAANSLTSADHNKIVRGLGILPGTRLIYTGAGTGTLTKTATNTTTEIGVQIGIRCASLDLFQAWSAEGNTTWALASADELINSLDTSGFHVGQIGHMDIASRVTRLLEAF